MNQLLLQTDPQTAITAMFAAMLPFFLVLALIVLISEWIIFKKAGRGGWEVLIPIYGALVLLKIVGKPWYWLLLFCIPFVGLIWAIWTINMLSKSFGKDEGFTIGLLLLGIVFYPILAFSKAEYQGPYGDKAAYQAYQNSKQPFDFEQKTV